MIGNRESKNQNGFTLMELIVVLALFSVMGLIIIDVFLLSMRSQRQASARQTILVNLRYAVETISRQIRTSELDYSYEYDLDNDDGIQGSEQELHLKDAQGNIYAYYLSDETLKISINGQTADLTNPQEIKVISLVFFIDPPINPFFEERCNGGLMPTGCQPAALVSCSINEPGNQFKAGFCICQKDSDCLTGRCDYVEWGDPEQAPGICLPFDKQPRVTFVLGLESVAAKEVERKRIYLQTTAASRIYKR